MTSWPAGIPGYYDDLGNPPKAQYIQGLMCWGQNPAVGGPSSSFERKNLANLEWLVCVDLWKTETAAFWEPDPNNPTDCIGIPGRAVNTVGTEVYLLPAAASYEKEGSITNSGRWSQWRWKALEPPGQAMDDLSIINELGKRLIAAYKLDPSSLLSDPVANLWWGPYCDPATSHLDAHGANGSNYDDGVIDPRTGLLQANPHKVAWEYNGYFCPTSTAVVGTVKGTRVDGFFSGTATVGNLRENGQTSSGNWLYCSHYINPIGGGGGNTDPMVTNGNRMEKRSTIDTASGIGLYNNWSMVWPLNRRIIYNGASVYQPGHPNVGQPLAPSKWVVAWDSGGTVARAGGDVADGYTPPGGATCRYPYIMLPEGVGKLFGSGREDGPFPEHYEPWETVMIEHPLTSLAGENPRHRPFDTVGSVSVTSPTAFAHARPEHFEHPGNKNPDFPIVGTTYRFTEHWQAGQMTRNNPWLCQLQPNTMIELSEELAAILGISNGDKLEVKTKRTDLYGITYFAAACVTKRFKPYSIEVDGSVETVHHIGTIWHYGYTGLCTDDSANLVTAHIGDANTGIPESKSFICNIRRNNGPLDIGPWLT
jgi:anaerobic selenocysteine-containing dehydrogenase